MATSLVFLASSSNADSYVNIGGVQWSNFSLGTASKENFGRTKVSREKETFQGFNLGIGKVESRISYGVDVSFRYVFREIVEGNKNSFERSSGVFSSYIVGSMKFGGNKLGLGTGLSKSEDRVNACSKIYGSRIIHENTEFGLGMESSDGKVVPYIFVGFNFKK